MTIRNGAECESIKSAKDFFRESWIVQSWIEWHRQYSWTNHSKNWIIFSTHKHQFWTAETWTKTRCEKILFFFSIADWITIPNLRMRMNCCYSSSLCQTFVFSSIGNSSNENENSFQWVCDHFDVVHKSQCLAAKRPVWLRRTEPMRCIIRMEFRSASHSTPCSEYENAGLHYCDWIGCKHQK